MNLLDQIESGEEIAPKALLEALTELFPLIAEMESTPQDPEWHAEGNVRIHTERVIAETYGVLAHEGEDLEGDVRTAMILGAALHDIGKTLTTREKEIDGRIRIVSPHHTERGRSYVAPRLAEIVPRQPLYDLILGIIGHHHAPKKLVARSSVPQSRFWRLSRAIPLRLIYLFELADLRGRDVAHGNDQEGFDYLELYRLAAEESGAWEAGDIYQDWRQRIAEQLNGADPEVVRYVTEAAIHQFEENQIFTPDEAIARTYERRDSPPHVLVTCAPSGSGKSTWVDRNCQGYERISLDEIREGLGKGRDDQSQNGKVLQAAKELLKTHLRARKRIVWDATSIRTDQRALVLDLARDYHASTRIVAFACPPKEILRRNRDRKAMIQSSVIEKQLDRLQWPEVWEAGSVETLFPAEE